MNKHKNFIAQYFNLSKKESNGFILLCILMSIIIITPAFYQTFRTPEQKLLMSDKTILDSLVTVIDENKNWDSPLRKSENEVAYNTSYSSFKPNSSTEQEMTASGVPEYISRRIVKFRSKGGKFKTKADLKKIYGLKETDYKKLYPYIDLSESNEQTSNLSRREPIAKTFPSTISSKQNINLNTTDSLQLISLKGIGPTFASRIIKYRNKLGGFIYKEQLKEVYGLDSIALKEIIINSTLR